MAALYHETNLMSITFCLKAINLAAPPKKIAAFRRHAAETSLLIRQLFSSTGNLFTPAYSPNPCLKRLN
jgi:hypothetical protein